MKNWIWLALALPGVVLAQNTERTLGAPVVAPTHSVEQADARLAQVKLERELADAEFAASEQDCYTKFFVNSCLDTAKERRRARLAELRATEVEASYFKRRYSLETRDRELEERAKKDAAEEAYRAANQATPPVDPTARPAPRPAAVSLEQRQAEHDAREAKRKATAAAQASQRAAKAEQFQRKQAESAKRQEEIAAKKAAKEEKARKRAAEVKPKPAA